MKRAPDPLSPRRLLARKELCATFNRSETSIWRWQRAGLLHPVYIAGRPFYSADEVERLIANGEAAA